VTTVESRSERPHRLGAARDNLISYQRLRFGIGLVGVVLFLTPVVYSLVTNTWKDSISGYYYTPLRNFFVGSVTLLGAFLVAYKGNSWLDTLLTDLAGLCAILLAWDPTYNAGARTWQNMLHPICASLAFGLLAIMALLFTQDSSRASTMEQLKLAALAAFFRNKQGFIPRTQMVYVICGDGILVTIIVYVVNELLHGSVPLIWFEGVMLFFFATCWITAGLRQARADDATSGANAARSGR